MVRKAAILFVSSAFPVVLPAHAIAAEGTAQNSEKGHLATESLQSCIARWDAGTHMSKAQWRETCQRVSNERGEFLRKQGALPEQK
jgi:hypothetical protein